MARYIDADKLKDNIIKLRKKLDTKRCSNDFACGWIIGVDNMEGLIDNQPTADVVEEPKWIDVNERLPKESGKVLIYRGYHMTICMYSKKHRLFNALDDNSKKDAKKYCINATHWMPLPEPPEGRSDSDDC